MRSALILPRTNLLSSLVYKDYEVTSLPVSVPEITAPKPIQVMIRLRQLSSHKELLPVTSCSKLVLTTCPPHSFILPVRYLPSWGIIKNNYILVWISCNHSMLGNGSNSLLNVVIMASKPLSNPELQCP